MAENSIIVRQGQAQRVQLEKLAVAALFPGHLVELTSADKVQKHSTAGGSVVPSMFAIEDENQGNGIDDAFAAADRVVTWIPQKGDWVLAVLADGQSVSIGDKLESAGTGALQKHVADTYSSAQQATITSNQIVGIAMEALDLSDSSGAEDSGALDYDQRLWIMIV
jgi:hypothetical protein